MAQICKRFFVGDEHLCKLDALIRIHSENLSQMENVIRLVADLLRVQNDLLELTRLRETLHDLCAKQNP